MTGKTRKRPKWNRPNERNAHQTVKFFFLKKKAINYSKITFDEARKLSQEGIDLVLVDIPDSGKSSNNTHEQQTSQKSTFNRSITSVQAA